MNTDNKYLREICAEYVTFVPLRQTHQHMTDNTIYSRVDLTRSISSQVTPHFT